MPESMIPSVPDTLSEIQDDRQYFKKVGTVLANAMLEDVFNGECTEIDEWLNEDFESTMDRRAMPEGDRILDGFLKLFGHTNLPERLDAYAILLGPYAEYATRGLIASLVQISMLMAIEEQGICLGKVDAYGSDMICGKISDPDRGEFMKIVRGEKEAVEGEFHGEHRPQAG